MIEIIDLKELREIGKELPDFEKTWIAHWKKETEQVCNDSMMKTVRVQMDTKEFLLKSVKTHIETENSLVEEGVLENSERTYSQTGENLNESNWYWTDSQRRQEYLEKKYEGITIDIS